MSKYSLKNVFYKNKSVLNEMAIITQSNFIERIVNILKKKPKVAGIEYSSYEDIVDSIESDDLNDKEKTLIREIVRCVNQTDLLSLTGKENKKARKQAEVLIIKQLRKYKNMDGEYIDFKGILPMFDNIADFLEEKADVSFDECINSADLYMRNFYSIAKKEDKEIIDKGKFNFEDVFKKTQVYRDFSEIRADAREAILPIYEDDTVDIVWPGTHEAFCQALIDLGYSLEELTHCTIYPSSWYSHHRDHYVTIAKPKSVTDRDDSDYFFSLKVNFDGSIDTDQTCDRDNRKTGDDVMSFLNSNAQEAIAFFPQKAREFLPQDKVEFDKYIKGFSELNDTNSLIDLFIKMLSILPFEEVCQKYKDIYDSKTISTENVAKVIAESVSYYLFDNTYVSTFEFSRLMKAKENYPVQEIFNYLKEKSVKNGSHVRYFNTLLSLFNVNLDKNMTFEEIKKSLEISIKSDNTANFKRVIDSFMNNDSVSYYLNYKSITNKTAGVTQNNLDLYNIIFDSPAMNSYINQNKINTVIHASKYYENAKTFLSLLSLRFPEKLVNKINDSLKQEDKKIRIEDLDARILAKYLLEDLGPDGLMARGTGIDREKVFLTTTLEDYVEVRNRIFYDVETLNKVFRNSTIDVRENAIMFICNSLKTNKNPLDIKKDKKTLAVLDNLLNYGDYDSDFIVSNFMFRLPFKMTQLSFDTKKKLALTVFSEKSLREKFSVLSEFAKSTGRLKESFFELLAYLDESMQIPTIMFIAKSVYAYGRHQRLVDYLTDVVENSLDDVGFQELVREITSESTARKPATYRTRSFHLDFSFPSALACSRVASKDIVNKCMVKITKSYFNYKQEIGKTDFSREFEEQIRNEIEKIDAKSACNQELIDLFSNEQLIDKVVSQYLTSHLFFTIANKFFVGCTLNNVVIPKKLLSAILSSQKNNPDLRPSSSLIEKIFTNFINLSSDGQNFLQGKELVLVRDTLITLLRKNSRNYFSYSGAKKIAIDCIMKLNPNARKHMILAFPELRDQFFEPTEAERAELQADSLIRQYVKMLLS